MRTWDLLSLDHKGREYRGAPRGLGEEFGRSQDGHSYARPAYTYAGPAYSHATWCLHAALRELLGYICTTRNQVSQRQVYQIGRCSFQSLNASVVLPQGQAAGLCDTYDIQDASTLLSSSFHLSWVG